MELGRAPDQALATCWTVRTPSRWVAWWVPAGRRGLGAMGRFVSGAQAAVCLCHPRLLPPLSGCPSLNSGLITYFRARGGRPPPSTHQTALPHGALPSSRGLMEEGRGHHPAPPADAPGTHWTLRTSIREPNLETKAGR